MGPVQICLYCRELKEKYKAPLSTTVVKRRDRKKVGGFGIFLRPLVSPENFDLKESCLGTYRNTPGYDQLDGKKQSSRRILSC